MIPKIFNIFWFGGKSYPYPQYFEGLKRLHPGWAVNVWAEGNVPLNLLHKKIRGIVLNPDVSPNYKSDCCRVNVLQNIGGVHVDPDFEFFRAITDDILQNDSFCGYAFQHWKSGYKHPNSGLFGTIPKGKWINELMDAFLLKLDAVTVDALCHAPIVSLNMTDELLKCDKIYEPDVFQQGYPTLPQSYSRHHWGGSKTGGWWSELKNKKV
jgi:hypothetical protein